MGVVVTPFYEEISIEGLGVTLRFEENIELAPHHNPPSPTIPVIVLSS